MFDRMKNKKKKYIIISLFLFTVISVFVISTLVVVSIQ